MTKRVREPLFHLVKRTESNAKRAWLIRIGAFVISLLLCAIVTVATTGQNFGFYFKYFFTGIFGSSLQAWNVFRETAILLLLALAVTPCFKMKYWNIGGEGQVLMGALGSAVVTFYLGGQIHDAGTIIIALIASIAFSIVWAVIPAIFKAIWNTNETLLTLMFNYIATCLVNFFIKKAIPSGTGDMHFENGVVPPIAGNAYWLIILIVAVVTVLVAIYLKYSKHGYELTVVGESANTARYIGINTKKVVIRTLVLCGVICGLAGFLLVSVRNHSINTASTVDGRGFTAVLVSWLAHFNPLAMVLTSFLVVFIDTGASEVATYGRLGNSYPSIMTGIFFLCIIATEFFINYKVIVKHSIMGGKTADLRKTAEYLPHAQENENLLREAESKETLSDEGGSEQCANGEDDVLSDESVEMKEA